MSVLTQYEENLLNEFEQRSDEWDYDDFERQLAQVKPSISNQAAKEIINKAHQLGRWPKTVKRYLLTNYQLHRNISCEINSVFRNIDSKLKFK